MVGVTFATFANAGLLDLKIGEAQIFDVQYYWSSSTNDANCGWGNEASCDTLNVSGLIAPYGSAGSYNFQHPTLTSGQYYGFINSPTVAGTYGMAVFNSDGTQAYVIHNTGDLYKLSGEGIFFVGGGFFGTVITPSTGYAYGSSATLNVGTGTPSSSDITSYTPPSTTVLAAGQSAPAPAPAYPVTNMDFATNDLTGWTAGGGTGTQSSTAYDEIGVGVSVVSGMTSYQANGSTHSWTVNPPAGAKMVSIQANNMQTVGTNDYNTMVTQFGLSTQSKNEITAALSATGNGLPTNAAWIYQDITLTNGQTFHVAWQYISTDYEPFNDGSITVLVNRTGTVIANVNGEQKEYALLGFTNQGTGNYATGSYGATGWQTAEYTSNEAGTYRFGFGSFNLSDTALSPILFVTKEVGTTFDFATPFGPIAPNPGSSAPNNSSGGGAVTVVSTTTGTPNVTGNNTTTATLQPVTNINYSDNTTGTEAGDTVTTTISSGTVTKTTDINGNPVITVTYNVTASYGSGTTIVTPITTVILNDGSNTTTSGTPVVTNAAQAAITSTVNGNVTTATTTGTSIISASTVNWPTTAVDTVAYSSTNSGGIVTVDKATTTVVDQPFTTTTTYTTPTTTVTTITPTSGTLTATSNSSTVDGVVQDVVNGDTYTSSTAHEYVTANINGAQNSVNYQNQNLFIVDPSFTPNGPWVTPSYSAGTVSGGNIGNNGYAFGWQTQANGNTVGVAGYYGSTGSSGYNNSSSGSTTLSATSYAIIDTDNGKIKAALGVANTDHTNTVSIPEFGMSNQQKLHQTNVYADLTYYAPVDIGGITPFAGVTVNNSDVADKGSSGSSLLAQSPETGNKTTTTPYVGGEYKVNDNVVIQAKVSQSPVYGTVVSGKAQVKQKITEDTSMFLSVGLDHGSNYDNGTIMAGFTFNF